MTIYAKISDQTVEVYPYTLSQLYRDHANTSFPSPISTSTLLDYGVVEVVTTPPPPYDPSTQKLSEADPVYEYGKWNQVWEVVALTAEELNRNLADQRMRSQMDRMIQIDNIVVTTSTGKQFDGDEVSQQRMARALLAMQLAQVGSTQWVLADNTISEVTCDDLGEALVLAGQKQSEIWMTIR